VAVREQCQREKMKLSFLYAANGLAANVKPASTSDVETKSMNTFAPVITLLLMISFATCTAGSQAATTNSDVVSMQQPVIVKLFGAGVGNLDSYGTAVLVSKDGHLLTVWNHLVSTGFLTAVTSDGRRFAVETVGTSSDHDAALLKLKSEPGDVFPFVDLSKANDLDVGSSIYAFSNMFRVAAGNEPVTVVHGVIAARVPLEATQGRWKFPVKSPVWLIDAITNNSGAAGGLLTDVNGTPVGLIGREIRQASSRTWVNYAVPLTTLAPVVEAIRSGKKLEVKPKDAASDVPMVSDQALTSRFGITMLPNVVERTPAFIDDIVDGSVAQKAGLRRSDLIVLVNDSVITSVTDFQQQMATFRAGQKVSLTVNRDQELKLLEFQIP
jgi:serine protease Do